MSQYISHPLFHSPIREGIGMNQALPVSSLSLISCLGLLALLMSTSVAQVNGPGPSSSSDFDTVVNLPNNQAVFSMIFSQGIGGVPGETIQLNVNEGGIVGNEFEVGAGSEVNISGGIVGFSFDPVDSEVNISGGSVGTAFDAGAGSVVNISGGTVGAGFNAFFGSEVNITGGTVEGFFDSLNGSVVNISGGTVGGSFDAGSIVGNPIGSVGSVVNISGGTVGNDFSASPDSQVNIFGGEFFIDDSELVTLLPGEAFTITDRDVVLSGLLADGEQFSFGRDAPRDACRARAIIVSVYQRGACVGTHAKAPSTNR